MRLIYLILTYLATPMLLLRLVYRCILNHEHGARWYERFGFYKTPLPQHSIWIHAVSLGEVNAVLPLVRKIKQQYPKVLLVVSTTTLTGAQQVAAQLKDEVRHVFLPYDLNGACKRFLRKLKPRIGILVETELWPHLLHQCKRYKIPTLLANARLSQKSAKGYQRFPGLVKPMLQGLTHLAIQSHEEAMRFTQLGASPEKISITGNIKFDQLLPKNLTERQSALKLQWKTDRFIWLVASTHKGEEETILKAFTEIKKVFSNLLLVLVPRHPERFNEVFQLCEDRSFNIVRASEQAPCELTTDVFLGDTMGELPYYFSAATLTFIGGSLVPIGGHNTLEAANCGLVIITGPHTFNFKLVNQLLKHAGALFEVADENELSEMVLHLLRNAQLRKLAGEKALSVMSDNRGSLQTHLNLVDQLLKNG